MVFEVVMITGKELKYLVNQIPDEAGVVLGDNFGCNIESISYDASEGFFRLHLTKGYGIVTRTFLDAMFNMATHRFNPGE